MAKEKQPGHILGDYDRWYKPCVNCGYDPGRSESDRCWKCGWHVYRDYSERALKKQQSKDVEV